MICKILSFFFSPSNRNFFSEKEKLESYAIKGQSHPAICARYTPLVLKVARYSFSKSIPPKFERKLRRHKQRFGKIDTTVVLDKVCNLTCKHKIFDKMLANSSPYFTTLQYINNLETKRSYKRTVYLKTLKLKKKNDRAV